MNPYLSLFVTVALSTNAMNSHAQVKIESCGKKENSNYVYNYSVTNDSSLGIEEIILGYSNLLHPSRQEYIEAFYLNAVPSERQRLEGDVRADNFTAPPGWQMLNFATEGSAKYAAKFTSYDFWADRRALSLAPVTVSKFSISTKIYDSNYLVGPSMVQLDHYPLGYIPQPIQVFFKPPLTTPAINVSLSPNEIRSNGQVHNIEVVISTSDDCDPKPTVYLESISEIGPDSVTGFTKNSVMVSNASYYTDDRNFSILALPKIDANFASRQFKVTYAVKNVSNVITKASATLTIKNSIK